MEYPVKTRQWTRAEYDRLIEIGVFDLGERVELLGGEILIAEPQSSPHYTAVALVEDALKLAFGSGWLVRTQGPLALDDRSEPEPDVAAVRGGVRDYGREHPVQPVLIVEVAEASLALDRAYKGSLYARARVPADSGSRIAHRASGGTELARVRQRSPPVVEPGRSSTADRRLTPRPAGPPRRGRSTESRRPRPSRPSPRPRRPARAGRGR